MARPFYAFSGAARLVAAFGLTILIGAAFLHSPYSAAHGAIPMLDALFTSTSAVCVTGLSTIDVGTQLSRTGQGMLLLLIQLGGLGITTFSTFFLVAAGRATLSHHLETQDHLSSVRIRASRLLMWIIPFTLIVEALGALVLASRLPEGDRWWNAVFHSVSAFCNAGFSLYPDSLIRFRSDHVITGTVALLVVLGGLGFIVHLQILAWVTARIKRKPLRLFLHARVVIVSSLVLWIVGAAAMLILESGNILLGLPWKERISSALFQSVSLRTSGFSTWDWSTCREITLYSAMFFMFVGGGPGGCAGGIKVTTVAVLLATIRARLRGRDDVSLFQRTVPPAIVRRAFQLVIIALFFAAAVILALLASEEPIGPQADQGHIMTVMAFETVSAFSTTGLSAGATPDLSPAGKILMIVSMFVGRLGPLVIALAVLPEEAKPRFAYPREELAIG